MNNINTALDVYAEYQVTRPSFIKEPTDLVMLSGTGMGKRIFKAVMELLYEALRRFGAFVLTYFSRTKGLKLDLANMKRTFANTAGKHIVNDDSLALSVTLGNAVRTTSRMSVDIPGITASLLDLNTLGGHLLTGDYPIALQRVGTTLERALESKRKVGTDIIEQINASVEELFITLSDNTRNSVSLNTELMGNMKLSAFVPSVRSGDAVVRSREYQRLTLDFEPTQAATGTIYLLPATMDEIGVLVKACEEALIILEKYAKDKVPEKLLKRTGDLQRKLNEVYRDTPDSEGIFDDSMIAFTRYLTAYTAWIQTPMADYASYYSRTVAAIIQVIRVALSKYQ